VVLCILYSEIERIQDRDYVPAAATFATERGCTACKGRQKKYICKTVKGQGKATSKILPINPCLLIDVTEIVG